MDKCREDLEAKFANSPELKEGHITWWEESHSYVAKTQDFQESADYWNQIRNAWQLRQPDIDLLEAKVEELKATIKGNHGRIAELEHLNRVKAQAIIDLHQEITELKASHHGEVIGHEVHFKKIKQERDELQKRVQFLEQELGAWKGKSIAAMINGMCKQCGKEPWQAIVSDKDGYALLHCFGCGADKYELIGEQALKGE